MNIEIENIKRTRIYLLDLIKELSIEQLNEIPIGLRNNVIWNVGHLLVSQQHICYLRAGQKMAIDDKYSPLYKTGSSPEKFVEDLEVERIKHLFISSIDQFENDYSNNLFSNFNGWTTQRYGQLKISNIDEAISFVFYHEGLHAGYIMTLKNLLKNKVS